MSDRCLTHNERLARHMERASPGRFAEFCAALRRYPLPVTSGAAATVLRGGSADAVRAVDAYCCAPQQRRQAPACGGTEVDVTSPPPGPSGGNDRTAAVPSPFRCLKLRRLEGGASLPWPLRRGGSADGSALRADDSDFLFTLLGPSCPPGGELRTGCLSPPVTRRGAGAQPMVQQLGLREARSRCASLGLLTAGTKKVLLARLRRHDVAQRAGPPAQPERVGGVQPQQPVEGGGAGGAPPRRFTSTHEEQLGHSQRLRTPFRSPSAGRQPPSPSPSGGQLQARRLVGTPQEFVAALMHEARRETGGGGPLAPLASGETAVQWQWRVLVDNRERIHGAHENVMKAFATAGVPAASCTLPCGDFLLGIDVPGGACGSHGTHPTAQEMSNPGAIHPAAAAVEGEDAPARNLFPVVVERKTVKDLCASIATPRYYEQRRLLSASPFRSVVWVVEGSTEQLRPDERRRVLSACASLAVVSRFRVIRTRHLKDTVSWLHSLGAAYVTALAKAAGGDARRPQLADFTACISVAARIKRALRARTTFPRMLMCVRGCSSGLATRLACKYGSLLQLWRRLRRYGREACDADLEVRRLSSAQRDVYVRLTEFLLAEEYC
ncbi:putative DNA repair protein [Trypanosoma conorhini]|uniref:Crossover junction endonuclease MUS81 n=1 Tax=Trypanosoma conorhini TaxID=83891 RepID=A0A422Q840_9TRYP|nr:putative DNA repair protein [Trypanosoma conorhini]RNF26126.1 putative DNA repair protein [Trypanosoma conorhini]